MAGAPAEIGRFLGLAGVPGQHGVHAGAAPVRRDLQASSSLMRNTALSTRTTNSRGVKSSLMRMTCMGFSGHGYTDRVVDIHAAAYPIVA